MPNGAHPCGNALKAETEHIPLNTPFFTFAKFESMASRDTDPNPVLRFLKNFGRNVKATGLYFLIGVALSALFQRYVPPDAFGKLFGGNRGFGVLMAATIGVPLYVCGGEPYRCYSNGSPPA